MSGTGKGNKYCPNGHTANANGECFESSCPYYVRKGQLWASTSQLFWVLQAVSWLTFYVCGGRTNAKRAADFRCIKHGIPFCAECNM